LRIAFYSPLAPTAEREASGDRTQALAVLAALRAQGHAVEVISEYKAKWFWRRSRLRHLPSAIRAARAKTNAFHPDAWLTFVSQWDAPDVMGPLLTAGRGIPYVIYKAPFKRGTLYADLGRCEGTFRHLWTALPGWLLHTIAMHRADAVVVNKVNDFDGYRGLPWVRDKLDLLWPAVPLDLFRPDESQRAPARGTIGVDDETTVLLSVGRLSDKKGRKATSLRFLIDATAELIGRGHRVHLVIVGEGDTRPGIEAHAAKLGTAVTFTGPVDYGDLPGWYNAADVFAYPGLKEYIGIVYLEAQACRLPVVAFDNGGIPAIVRDGETGLLVPPMDLPVFVSQLERLVRDPELRRRLGAAARAHVEQRHDLAVWGATLADRLVIAGKKRSGSETSQWWARIRT
jgi:phosphatidylinositol alpha-1,6-mannosyltransferase